MSSRAAPLALFGLALLAALALVRSGPPAPQPVDAPVTEFSAMRAQKELLDLVGDGAPHPAGTTAHDRVRDAVDDKLRHLGFEVLRQSDFICGPRTCASVTNLLARLPGNVGAEAVLLTAHYDSVPAGPGASDDGMGVATLLEAARALKASPTLRRPVWFLVTDGEELGLLGAKAFAKDKPLFDQVGVVVNVEARGTRGSSLMFETSAKNAGLVRIFSAATKHPVASSLFPTIYALLPNDTDLSVYKAAGLAGLNYAVIGGGARYHTPKDDADHADLGSLQHHGDNALAVVRALASGRQSTAAEGNLVFFDLLGWVVVGWTDRKGPWLVLALLLAYALATVTAFRRGVMTPGEHARGLLALIAPGAAAGLAWGAEVGLRALGAAPAPWIAQPTPLIVASCGIGGLASAAVVVAIARTARAPGIFWGAALLFLGIGAVLALTYPGLSFLFLAPAMCGVAGCVAWAWTRGGDPRAFGTKTVLWTSLLPVCAVLVWVPPLGLLYDALGARLLPAVAAGTAIVVWSAGALVVELPPRFRSIVSSVIATGTLVAAAGALAVVPFSPDTPAHASFRTFVTESGDARTTLATFGYVPPKLAGLFPRMDVPWPWSAESAPATALTPVSPVPAPLLEGAASTERGSGRHVVATLKSARGAAIVGLAIRASADPTAIRVQGEPLPSDPRANPSWRWFECFTTPPEGVDVELDVAGQGPVEAYVYDRTPGALPKSLVDARPSAAVPFQNGDVTVVARRVEL